MSTSCASDVARDAAPRLSAEIFTIDLSDGRYLIYAPLRRVAFVANAATVNFLAGLRDGTHAAASDNDRTLLALLRRLALVDAGPEPLPITERTGSPEPTNVTLFMTTACNLRCTYCYANAGDTPTKFLSIEVARRAIDFVSANAARQGLGEFEVGYHGGGEATVNWPVMVASFAHAEQRGRELGLRLRAGVATNGVLNDRQIEWIIGHLSGASISIDGTPSTQDKNRPLRTGKGSSARVLKTIKAFDDAGFPYSLRVTVTAEDIPHLCETIDFLVAQFRPGHIQVEPVYQLGRWREGPSAEIEEFVGSYRLAKAIAARAGIELQYSAARLDTLTNHFCGISQDSFCVSPNGNVSACYEAFSEDTEFAPLFFYGKPKADAGAGYEFDLAKLQALRNQAVQHRPYCQGCFAKWHCAGDCYHKSLSADPKEFKGAGRCDITRSLTRDMILDRIHASGGLIWDGNDAGPGCDAHAGEQGASDEIDADGVPR